MEKTARKTIKEVGYAYPSSDIATRMGKAKEGCWIVRTFDASLKIAPIEHEGRGFATKAEAFACADLLPYPFGKYSMNREGGAQ